MEALGPSRELQRKQMEVSRGGTVQLCRKVRSGAWWLFLRIQGGLERLGLSSLPRSYEYVAFTQKVNSSFYNFWSWRRSHGQLSQGTDQGKEDVWAGPMTIKGAEWNRKRNWIPKSVPADPLERTALVIKQFSLRLKYSIQWEAPWTGR